LILTRLEKVTTRPLRVSSGRHSRMDGKVMDTTGHSFYSILKIGTLTRQLSNLSL
jgi:hypothetical protein